MKKSVIILLLILLLSINSGQTEVQEENKQLDFNENQSIPLPYESENNDVISSSGFLGNNAGGILAGISNGEHLVMRVAVKPIPSIRKEQQTVNLKNEEVEIKIGGRHDISAIPRIVPVCEAMVRLTLADHFLRQAAMKQFRKC